MPLGTFVNPESERGKRKTGLGKFFARVDKKRNHKKLAKKTGKLVKKLGSKAVTSLRNRKSKLEKEIARQERRITKLRQARDKLAKTRANIDKRDRIREELQDELGKLKKERTQLQSLRTQIKNGS